MQPRPFWAPLYGITNSKLYFTTLWNSLKDVTDNCYFFRAYKIPDGSVKNATAFLPGPLLQSHGLMKAIQEVSQMACGFLVEQSQAYTQHSPRHFLPEISVARGEPGTCRCKIGRWSHRVAQLPALRPETNMLKTQSKGFNPSGFVRKKTTLHSVLWLFLEDKWRHCATFQSSAAQDNYPCTDVSRIQQNTRQQVDHTKTKDARRPKRGPTHLGPKECETQEWWDLTGPWVLNNLSWFDSECLWWFSNTKYNQTWFNHMYNLSWLSVWHPPPVRFLLVDPRWYE